MTDDPRVMAIQDALNRKWEANLAVDGVWGPKTCYQLYDFQQHWLFDDSPLIKAKAFTELGLPAEWVNEFEMACTPWYHGGVAPGPVVSPPETAVPPGDEAIVTPPEPSTPIDWKSWILPVAGAASGVLIGLAGREVVAKGRGDPLLFGAMGGLAGLVGGLVARGVMRR